MEEKKASTQSGWKTLLSRNFILVLAISCFNQFATMAVKTPINRFGNELGIAVSMLGMITTMYQASKMIVRPVWGNLNDKLNRKLAMTVALSVQAVAYCIYAITNAVPLYIIGRFVEGVSFGIVSTSVYSALGTAVDRRVLGTAMGFYATFPQLVKALAPSLSMSLYTNHGAKYSFLTAVGCTVVSIVLAQFMDFSNVRSAPRAVEIKTEKANEVKGVEKFFTVKSLYFLPYLLADGFQNGVLDLTVVLYATALGCPEAGALFFSVQAFVTIFVAIPFGFIQDKVGGKVSVVIALCCRAAGCLLIAISPSATTFVIAGILCGTAKPGNNVIQTENMKLVPKSRFGVANSSLLLMCDFTVMIGAAVGGFLVDYAGGYTTCFIVAAVALLVGAGVYLAEQPKLKRLAAQAAAEE